MTLIIGETICNCGMNIIELKRKPRTINKKDIVKQKGIYVRIYPDEIFTENIKWVSITSLRKSPIIL